MSQTDQNGDTALTLACQYGKESTVRKIIEKNQTLVRKIGKSKRNCALSAAAGSKIEILQGKSFNDCTWIVHSN